MKRAQLEDNSRWMRSPSGVRIRPVSGRERRTTGAHYAFTINGRFLRQPVTGVQRYAREVLEQLDRVLSSGGTKALLCAPQRTTPPRLAAFDVDTDSPLEGHLWEQASLPLRIEGPLLSLCNLGPLLARRQLLCIHDMNVRLVPESYSWAFRSVYRSLVPMIAKRSTVLVTVSHYSARMISHYLGVDRKRIGVFPNGHEHAFGWRGNRSDIFDRHEHRRPYVLIIGSRARHKNIDLVLGLAGELDRIGIDIWIAGPSPVIFAAASMARASNVKQLGYVSDDDLAALYSNALCLAFPSLTEGFGLPLVEAMALRCPIVTSDRGSMPEVCDKAALYADPDDREQWLAHFTALLRSRSLRLDLQGAGERRVSAFSWRETAARYHDAILRLH